jgi:hypothetical protein
VWFGGYDVVKDATYAFDGVIVVLKPSAAACPLAVSTTVNRPAIATQGPIFLAMTIWKPRNSRLENAWRLRRSAAFSDPGEGSDSLQKQRDMLLFALATASNEANSDSNGAKMRTGCCYMQFG